MEKACWDKLCQETAVCDEHRCGIWNEIESHYGELQRHYHTMSHIQDLLKLFETHSDKIKDCSTVLMAIYFHDIIYDPTRADNEEKSAEYFQQMLPLLNQKNCGGSEPSNSVATFNGTKIVDFILQTKAHAVDSSVGDGVDNMDLKLFLDFDMAVLGTADIEDYLLYAKKIRREYIHVPLDVYCEKRGEFLKGMLQEHSPAIYSTPLFQASHEHHAHDNLRQEIVWLENKSHIFDDE